MRKESSPAISIRSAVSQRMRAISRFSKFHCTQVGQTSWSRCARKGLNTSKLQEAGRQTGVCPIDLMLSRLRLQHQGRKLLVLGDLKIGERNRGGFVPRARC